jgi:predicted GNAT family acetyltransferase
MGRFEMTSGDAIAFVEYRRDGDLIVLTRTEVPDALSGQGVGSRLVAGALDRIRSEGAAVVARCEFVAAFIRRHPGYRDLEAAG